MALWAKFAKVPSLDDENERLAGTEVSSRGLDVDVQIDGFVWRQRFSVIGLMRVSNLVPEGTLAQSTSGSTEPPPGNMAFIDESVVWEEDRVALGVSLVQCDEDISVCGLTCDCET